MNITSNSENVMNVQNVKMRPSLLVKFRILGESLKWTLLFIPSDIHVLGMQLTCFISLILHHSWQSQDWFILVWMKGMETAFKWAKSCVSCQALCCYECRCSLWTYPCEGCLVFGWWVLVIPCEVFGIYSTQSDCVCLIVRFCIHSVSIDSYKFSILDYWISSSFLQAELPYCTELSKMK